LSPGLSPRFLLSEFAVGRCDLVELSAPYERPRRLNGFMGPDEFSVDRAEQIMLVILDGKRLESPLPRMAAAVVMTMIAVNVRRPQPLHPTAEVAIFARPDKPVKMIGDQAVPNQSHCDSVVRLPHQVDERKKTVRLWNRHCEHFHD